jgi:hypothetical protein
MSEEHLIRVMIVDDHRMACRRYVAVYDRRIPFCLEVPHG